MKCVHQRVSYASWRLQTFRRLFLPSTNSISSTRCAFSSAPSPTAPDSASHQSNLAQDEDTGSAEESEPRRPSEMLPQSPLLTHPRLVNPEKYKKRKRRPTPDDNADLRKNPWAMALTSPVRMCAATKTRLPIEFMGDWGFIQPKGTEELWFSPIGLMKHELATAKSKQHEGDVMEHPGIQTQMQSLRSTQQRETRRPLTLRIIDRLPLFRLLNGILSKGEFLRSRSPVFRLFPTKWKYPHGPITAKEEKRAIWREDMPEFLLGRIRKMVMLKLTRAARLHKHVGAPSGVWTAVEMGDSGNAEGALVEGLKQLAPFERMRTGAVLVLGPRVRDPSAKDQDYPPSSSLSVFPEFVTLPQTRSKVPVFDLSVLFSEAEQEELKNSYSHFQGAAIFFRPDDTVTVQTMLALWKLKSALRELP